MTEGSGKKTRLEVREDGEPPRTFSLGTAASLAIATTKTKEDIISVITTPLDDYSTIILSEEEALKLQKHIRKASLGSTSFAPMICAGAACSFALQCPLAQMGKSTQNPHGKAPVGLQCLLEITAMGDWLKSYVQEYEVDPNSFTEINICNELAEIEVLLWRLNMTLSRPENASLIIDQVVGVTPRGEEITQQQISPVLMAKQQLNNRKSKLVKLMVGDRQEKYKKEAALKQKTESDPSTKQASTKAKLEKLQRELDEHAIDAEIVTPEDLISGKK